MEHHAHSISEQNDSQSNNNTLNIVSIQYEDREIVELQDLEILS